MDGWMDGLKAKATEKKEPKRYCGVDSYILKYRVSSMTYYRHCDQAFHFPFS